MLFSEKGVGYNPPNKKNSSKNIFVKET